MGKAVINTCYGGFKISEKAYDWLKEHNIDEDLIEKWNSRHTGLSSCQYHGPRHHPLLIQCVEELGEEASDYYSKLKVVEFEGDLYQIDEYDGLESIETPDQIYWNNCNDY